ncbi:MAG: rRNA cytosine-C5-methyltransferase, partial [Bacteroidales bacterium]|nr:rRNA cytosine-C5-methyltransferase [Bacteroidales bacterium]
DSLVEQGLYLLQSGIEMGIIKGRDIIPAHALALSTVRKDSAFPTVELDLDSALNYLRHEAILLEATTPTGYVIVTYQGHALGFVKNLGNRSNNMYPQEWRIRYL